jgi:hypothetical protein
MRMNPRSFVCLTAWLFIVGCKTSPPSAEGEWLPLYARPGFPAKLIPAEIAKPVQLKLRDIATGVSDNDVEQVMQIVGRVPGLRKYEIQRIQNSRFYDQALDVWVYPYVLAIRTAPAWEVIGIRMPSP